MTPSEIAYAAADYMAEHGHCKYMLWNDEGNVCLLGALMKVTDASLLFFNATTAGAEIFDTLTAILIRRGESPCGSLPVIWNNDPCTTAEDAILLLKEAGVELAGQETARDAFHARLAKSGA